MAKRPKDISTRTWRSLVGRSRPRNLENISDLEKAIESVEAGEIPQEVLDGLMEKSVYDANGNNKVDAAETADTATIASGLDGNVDGGTL